MAVDIGIILVELFALVLLAQVAGVLCDALKIPSVVGEIVMGIIIGNLIIGGSSIFDWLQLSDEANFPIFEVFAELGIIFLLFTVGLETPFHELRKVGKTATIVAILGVILPFVAGFAIIVAFSFGSMIEALFIGTAMVATSVGITARVIKDMGVTDTIESKVIIGAAVIDDVLGLTVLAVVSGMASGGALDILDVAVVAGLAVGFVLAVMFISILIPKAKRLAAHRNRAKGEKGRKIKLPTHLSPLPFALIICFGLSALASFLSLAAIVGAFLAGMIFAEFRDSWPCEQKFAPINEFLVPFFFLLVGINLRIESLLSSEIILLVVIITAAAFLSKYIGCGLGAKRLGKGSAMIVGSGMIPRGEVGIIVASIALATGAFSSSLYAVVVSMSLITTLVAPFLIVYAYKRKDRLVGAGLRVFRE